MSLYTKTGDDGTTALATGQRVTKTDPRLEAYGTIDELNSHIGLLLALAPRHRPTLLPVQRALFTVGAILAGAPATSQPTNAPQPTSATTQPDNLTTQPDNHAPQPTSATTRPDDHTTSFFYSEVTAIEQAIDALGLPPWRGFTVPGGSHAAAQAHVCRTVCRRAERRMTACEGIGDLRPEVLRPVRIYVNRLSDYLYALALKINQEDGVTENLWHDK